MKVTIEDKVYLVHFETRKHNAKYGDTGKKLSKVTCFIRDIYKNLLSEGYVSQNYRDKGNLVFARKLAFTEAVGKKANTVGDDKKEVAVYIFNKETRTAFWNEFKDKCRYQKNDSLISKNLRLEKEIEAVLAYNKDLEERLEQLEIPTTSS